jgi:hypothetical protein
MSDSKRHRAVIESGEEPSGEFERLLTETLEQSDFMEVDATGDGIHVYEQGPFRDIALDNLPFGPIESDATIGSDSGVYAECHIIRSEDDGEYIGVWHYGDGAAWVESKPDFVLKTEQGGSSDRTELSVKQAKHLVKAYGGWDYVE